MAYCSHNDALTLVTREISSTVAILYRIGRNYYVYCAGTLLKKKREAYIRSFHFIVFAKSIIGNIAATSGSRARLFTSEIDRNKIFLMASSETRETIENGNVDVTEIENGFKKDKARAKSNFTRSQNRLLLLLEEQDMDSRISVIEARKKLESCLEIALDILENFSDSYIYQTKRTLKCEHIVGDVLRIEEVPVNDSMSVTSAGGRENAEKGEHENVYEIISTDSVMNARAAPFEPCDQFHRKSSVPTASYDTPFGAS